MEMEMVTFTIDRKDKAILKRSSRTRGLTLSSMIRLVLREYIEREKVSR